MKNQSVETINEASFRLTILTPRLTQLAEAVIEAAKEVKEEVRRDNQQRQRQGATLPMSPLFRDSPSLRLRFAFASSQDFKFLYDLNLPIKDKISAVCTSIYRAGSVSYTPLALQQISQYSSSGFGAFPICMAKTQYSFSCDPSAKGAPGGFEVKVREVRACAGAGFLYPIAGDIMTIPGLPTRPGFYDVDIDEDGEVVGLF